MDLSELAGGGQHHLRGFGDLALVAQNAHVRENVSGIVACFRRHRLKQLLGIAAFAVERCARLRDGNVGAPEPARGSHRGFVVGGKEPLL
jgi:hypothetical protein